MLKLDRNDLAAGVFLFLIAVVYGPAVPSLIAQVLTRLRRGRADG
jgi:hypothetical protein